MTKLQVTSPVITADTLEWLRMVCDVPPSASDDNKKLRWKAAQRDVYIQAKAVHDRSIAQNTTSADKAAQLGHKIRSED